MHYSSNTVVHWGTFCGTLYSRQYITTVEVSVVFSFWITGIYLHDILNNLQICVHTLMDILHSCPHPALQCCGEKWRRPLWIFKVMWRPQSSLLWVTEWSWKFDFSEAYNNCQCLQFKSSAASESTEMFRVMSNILPD